MSACGLRLGRFGDTAGRTAIILSTTTLNNVEVTHCGLSAAERLICTGDNTHCRQPLFFEERGCRAH